jgi:hypothetical protein
MALVPGVRLGNYEILAPLGAGGVPVREAMDIDGAALQAMTLDGPAVRSAEESHREGGGRFEGFS